MKHDLITVPIGLKMMSINERLTATQTRVILKKAFGKKTTSQCLLFIEKNGGSEKLAEQLALGYATRPLCENGRITL